MMAGVDIILGCNGMIWVAASSGKRVAANGSAGASGGAAGGSNMHVYQQKEAVCRVANAVRTLGILNLMITPSSILHVCKVCAVKQPPYPLLTRV